ncbi:MAG: hypothetical protein WC966_01780 [Bradymonadales bacterium]
MCSVRGGGGEEVEVGLRRLVFLTVLLVFFGGCAVELVGDKGDLSQLEYPTGVALHPNGRFLYVVGSNFDLKYRVTDGGVVSVVDLESGKLVEGAAKRMGSFGTSIVLAEGARRGYTLTRNDDCVVWFEISQEGSEISCPLATEKDPDSLLKCRYCIDDDPTDLKVVRSYRELELEGGEKQRVEFDLLMVAHLVASKVSAITVRGEGKDVEFSSAAASLVYGASEVQWQSGENFFVTGRSATNLALLSPAINASGEVLGLQVKRRVGVPLAFSSFQGRGLAFSPNKTFLYMLNQLPNSILAFDVSALLVDGGDGFEPRMVGMELMQREPMKLLWVGAEQGGVLYLTSFKDDALVLVDPQSLAIIKQVPVGDGPYELVYDSQAKRLIISHFRSAELWIMDVSDAENPVLSKRLFAAESESQNGTEE